MKQKTNNNHKRTSTTINSSSTSTIKKKKTSSSNTHNKKSTRKKKGSRHCCCCDQPITTKTVYNFSQYEHLLIALFPNVSLSSPSNNNNKVCLRCVSASKAHVNMIQKVTCACCDSPINDHQYNFHNHTYMDIYVQLNPKAPLHNGVKVCQLCYVKAKKLKNCGMSATHVSTKALSSTQSDETDGDDDNGDGDYRDDSYNKKGKASMRALRARNRNRNRILHDKHDESHDTDSPSQQHGESNTNCSKNNEHENDSENDDDDHDMHNDTSVVHDESTPTTTTTTTAVMDSSILLSTNHDTTQSPSAIIKEEIVSNDIVKMQQQQEYDEHEVFLNDDPLSFLSSNTMHDDYDDSAWMEMMMKTITPNQSINNHRDLEKDNHLSSLILSIKVHTWGDDGRLLLLGTYNAFIQNDPTLNRESEQRSSEMMTYNEMIDMLEGELRMRMSAPFLSIVKLMLHNDTHQKPILFRARPGKENVREFQLSEYDTLVACVRDVSFSSDRFQMFR